MRKNFEPTKQPREEISNPREKHFGPTKHPRRHGGTLARDPQHPLWHANHES